MVNTFYFIRHGYSCANIHKSKGNIVSQKTIRDPHLTNWGIISSILAGLEFPYRGHFDYIFVSPLVRTWETAAAMFSSRSRKYLIAPYLRERMGGLVGEVITLADDKPADYRDNVIKFENFKDFVDILSEMDVGRKNIRYIFENGERVEQKPVKDILRKIKGVKINRVEEYDVRYVGKGNLEKFIEWINRRVNGKTIAVVCHGTLIRNLYRKYGDGGMENFPVENNNFAVRVETNNLGEITKCRLFYQGVEKPTKKQLDKITIECSLCEKAFSLKRGECADLMKIYNKRVHHELFLPRNL